jgi:GNAT superfamily N-acetyltransferase
VKKSDLPGHVTQVTAMDCLALRSLVLRPGLDIKYSIFAGDDLPSTYHFAFLDPQGTPLSVATFMQEPFSVFPNLSPAYRLRGMATDPSHQRQGLGRKVLLRAEHFLRHHNVKVLWCNARTSAISFYEKMGFMVSGEEFNIEQVGPHKVMYKEFK